MQLEINVDKILEGIKSDGARSCPNALEESIDVEMVRQFREALQKEATPSGLAPETDVTIVFHGQPYPIMAHDEVGVLVQWHRILRYKKLRLL